MSREDNELYHDLITKFHRLTGVPMVPLDQVRAAVLHEGADPARPAVFPA